MTGENKKDAKKERALERLEVTSQRTSEEQLVRLDQMFGSGQGAIKERAKLLKRIEERNKVPHQDDKTEVVEQTQPQNIEQ